MMSGESTIIRLCLAGLWAQIVFAFFFVSLLLSDIVPVMQNQFTYSSAFIRCHCRYRHHRRRHRHRCPPLRACASFSLPVPFEPGAISYPFAISYLLLDGSWPGELPQGRHAACRGPSQTTRRRCRQVSPAYLFLDRFRSEVGDRSRLL